MALDINRIEEYLVDITTEVYDVRSVLDQADEQVLQDRHLIKSLKYSTIVIAEAKGICLLNPLPPFSIHHCL